MRSVAAAFAWEFRRRHRWGLVAVIAYLVVVAVIRLVFFRPGRIQFEAAESFAIAVVVPLTGTFMYFLAVFSFGLAGDLAARQSIYPARMFTLPVTTTALAAWPMLYGSIAMAILWLATRFLVVWPANVEVPVFWPMLLAPSLLAWTQALTWMGYPMPGLRVIVTVIWLASIDAIVMIALELKTSEPVMLAILAPNLPLAFLVARVAVGRARRGDLGGLWSGGRLGRQLKFRRPRAAAAPLAFASPAKAQTWFEWRQHGRSLPWLVAMVVPFELALLFPFKQTPVIIAETLLGVLFTPPFMAAFVAATVSQSNPQASDAYGVAPLIATRPMTNAGLIAAKLKVTIASSLVTWLVVLVAIPIAVRLSGTAPTVIEWGRELAKSVGMPRAIAIVLLSVALFMLSTWKQLVQSLYIAMSGREWLIKAAVFVALAFLAVIVPVAHWALGSEIVMAALWASLPWILSGFAALKIIAASWIAIRLHDRRVISDRMLLAGAILWDVALLALFAVFAWIAPALIIPRYVLVLLAILAVPLVRLSAAPLALAWNRHR